MRYIAMIFVLFWSSSSVSAQYYGEFLDELDVYWVIGDGDDWNTIVLQSEYRFRDANTLLWTTPNGHEVNGASIPRWAWTIVGSPYTGRYLPASVIHDYYVNTKERTAHDTHRNFYYGMMANGVPWYKAKTMHWAVSVYTDWDVETPERQELLVPSTRQAEQELAGALRSVEDAFRAESEAIANGQIPSPLFGLDQLEIDAQNFRSVLEGENRPDSYDGIATQNGIPSVFGLIEQGDVNFDLLEDFSQIPAWSDGFGDPFSEANFGMPAGVQFSVTVDPSDMTSEFATVTDSFNADSFAFMPEGKWSTEALKAVDGNLHDSVMDAVSAMASKSPHGEVGVYFNPSALAAMGGVSTGDFDGIEMVSDQSVTILESDSLIQATPNVSFADHSLFGTVMTGQGLEDGSFQIKGVAPISTYSGFTPSQ